MMIFFLTGTVGYRRHLVELQVTAGGTVLRRRRTVDQKMARHKYVLFKYTIL